MKRVVVTGMGAVTPIGNSVEEFWDNIKKNTVGIGEITKFDVSDYKCKLAAEVKNFDPKQYMDPKAARRMEPFCQYAIAATGEAIKDAGLDLEKEDRTRIGTCIGNGLGGVATIEKEHKKVVEGKANRVSVMMVPMMISNMAAGNVAIQFGLEGKCTDIVTACATGTNSIGEAYRYIQAGEADVMVAGGAESPICETNVSGFISMTALSSAEDPMRASIPFDKDRCGFVIAEGAGVVVLESLEHAQARGAQILAEVVGYGSTCDAYHITSPKEDGSGAGRAMKLAMEEADSCVSGSRFNDNRTFFQDSFLFCIFDHRLRNTILYTSCRIQILKLYKNCCFKSKLFFQIHRFNKWCVSNQSKCAFINCCHSLYPHFLY